MLIANFLEKTEEQIMLKGNSKEFWVMVTLWHTSDSATAFSKKIDVFGELLDHLWPISPAKVLRFH